MGILNALAAPSNSTHIPARAAGLCNKPRKTKGIFATILIGASLTCAASVAAAGTLRCLAQEQCRGDAKAMCAPSSLEIEVRKQNGYNRLWIDKQGPYTADYNLEGGDRRWRVEAFGGQHRLDLKADGQFVYLGNRGKRYSGQCEGQV